MQSKLTTCPTNIILALALVSLLLLSQSALAGHNDKDYRSTRSSQSSYVYADVVDVEPIVRYVTVSRPERVCEEVEIYDDRRHRHDSANGTIKGGLLGGLIGRQVGGGKGRDAATIAGVLIGSAIGHDNQVKQERNTRPPEVRTREQCHTRYERHEEERIDGYRVTYLFEGEEFTTRTSYEPGKKIRLAVTARPAPEGDRRYSRYDDYDDD